MEQLLEPNELKTILCHQHVTKMKFKNQKSTPIHFTVE